MNLNALIAQEAKAATFARGVVVLEPDLEKYLGWNQPASASLKPGLALWNYEQQGADTMRLTNLCQMIHDAIGNS
jgi:hypothetical protein